MTTIRLSQFKTLILFSLLAGISHTYATVSQPVNPWPGDNPPGTITPNPAAEAAARARAQALAQQQREAYEQEESEAYGAQPQSPQNPAMQNIMQFLNGGGMPGSGGAYSGSGSGPFGSSGRNDYSPVSQVPGSGRVDPCGTLPPSVVEAKQIALNFRSRCTLAQRGGGQKIVINDYSGQARTPHMYIFDVTGQNCLGKTAVAYGHGDRKSPPPMPCSDNGDRLTPPGFHLTSVHNGTTYKAHNSVGLTSLEGQGSGARGVVIHAEDPAGMATTWGCPGVGSAAFPEVKRLLGEGSLVYNFFGATQSPNDCDNTRGLSQAHNFCQMEPGKSVPSISTGASGGSTTAQ